MCFAIKMNLKLRIFRNIAIAIFLVVAVNLAVLYYLDFPQMALIQIEKYFVLLILLVLGFAFQIGLYTYLKHKSIFCSGTMAFSGGVSSISMILCCSHYIFNFLPFVSLALANSLTKYTFQILLFGIFSNVVGILFMVRKIKSVGGENG